MATSCLKIGTHNGTFHCDEVLACYMLKKLPEYYDAEIIRTRDQQLLDTCDIVVDVGGVYDPKKRRFDHHQRTFSETMHSLDSRKPWTIKLSSAGLVYYHFGARILSEITGHFIDSEVVTKGFDYIYEHFIEEVDAIDNGVEMCSEEPKYRIHSNLSSRVSYLNPTWNAEKQVETANFFKAFNMVGQEFEDRVNFMASSWWPARDLVVSVLSKRFQVYDGGEIIAFADGVSCPWKEHIFSLEKEQHIKPGIKFVLYSDENGSWRVQAVPVKLGSFASRLPLLEEWRGLRGEELDNVSGIEGCVFVHASGFTGGNKTYKGCLAMAVKTLEISELKQS